MLIEVAEDTYLESDMIVGILSAHVCAGREARADARLNNRLVNLKGSVKKMRSVVLLRNGWVATASISPKVLSQRVTRKQVDFRAAASVKIVKYALPLFLAKNPLEREHGLAKLGELVAGSRETFK